MSPQEHNNEKKVKDAARKVFHSEGFAGSRMQTIADEAGINKMMLHYYFRSKQQLFDVIFEEDYMTLMAPLAKILRNPALHVEDQVITFSRRYHDTMMRNPKFPLFMIHEFAKNPGRILELAQKAIPVSKADEPDHPELSATTFMDQIDEGIKEGKYNDDIDAQSLAVSMLGMCMYPFTGRTVVQTAYQMTDEQYDDFLEKRKEEVIRHTFRILMKPEYYQNWKQEYQKKQKQ